MSSSTPVLGDVSVSVLAGHLHPTSEAANERIGKQIQMGNTGLYFHILPETAKQWIETLTPIAQEASE